MGNIDNIVSGGIGGATGPASQASGLLGGSVPPGGASNSASEDVTLTVGTQQISGWQSIRISRGIERMPADFDIKLTEKYPGAVANVIIQPGMTCVLTIGANQVMKGYVDKYIPEIEADNHTIRITGRSKCQDLVDCSAIWPTGQIVSTDALDIATKLAKPYNIKVSTLASQKNLFPLPKVPQQMVMYSEAPVDIISRSCRHSGLLFYDDENGDLVLAQVGTTKAACGFQEGVNIQRAAGTFTMDQRFSFMAVRLQPLAFLTDAGNQGSVLYPPTGEPKITYDAKGNPTATFSPHADPGVVRFRNKNLLCEYPLSLVNGQQYMKLLWEWETKRRYGRSFRADITTDSWRDSAGKLWTPNTLVDIIIPSIRMLNRVTYVISEVTYSRDEENGTTCQIVAMPPDAFNVQPIVLVPQVPDAGSPLQIPSQPNSGQPATQTSAPAVSATSPAKGTSSPSLVAPLGTQPGDGTDFLSIIAPTKGK